MIAQVAPTISPDVGVHEPGMYILAVAFIGVVGLFCLYLWRKDRVDKESRDAMLSFVSDQTERMDETLDKRDGEIKRMGDACHITQQEITKITASALDRNTAVVQENTTALAINSELVRDVRRIIHENIQRARDQQG